MSFKNILVTMAFVSVSIITTPSYAEICGIGKVTEVREGIFDTEDLVIRLNTGVVGGQPLDPQHEGTLYLDKWIRFRASTLSADRLQSMRAIAYLALATGKSAYVYTHDDVNGCSNAGELSVFNDGVNPRS